MLSKLSNTKTLYRTISPNIYFASKKVEYSTTIKKPLNFGISFVPEKHAYVVERFGKYLKTLQPGLNLLIPFIDRIAYVQVLKEMAFDIAEQAAITSDNVVLEINGVLFVKVMNPELASYGVEDGEFALTQLAQTTMRSEIGKLQLDMVFKDRETLNLNIVDSINVAAEPWGIKCMRYEIRDIHIPDNIKKAMEMQVEADRRKRALILESEGLRDSAINKASGLKESKILESEGFKIERVNQATAQAEALERIAEGQCNAIKKLASSLTAPCGADAVRWSVAENYIKAFQHLAKTNNTVIMPSNTGDVNEMVTKAMSIFGAVNKTVNTSPPPGKSEGEVENEGLSLRGMNLDDIPSFDGVRSEEGKHLGEYVTEKSSFDETN